jgi:hypothetical protein
MHPAEGIGNYLGILKVREAGRRRELTITGGLFLLSFLGFIASGLLTRPNSNSVYISGGLAAVLGLIYVMAWVRLEILRHSIEVLDHLQKILGGSTW